MNRSKMPGSTRPSKAGERSLRMLATLAAAALAASFSGQVHAQMQKPAAGMAAPAAALPAPPLPSSGTVVTVPAESLVKQANDEAHLSLVIEEQDRDKAQAASRVNLKMKQGTEIVRRADPGAILKTRGYYTYPVYGDEVPGKPARSRPIVSWRVGQYLDVTTTDLAGLPAVVAASQKLLAVSNLNFGLSAETARRLDDRRIAATLQNLQQRMASIARAMGRAPADALLESVDFEGGGTIGPMMNADMAKMSMRAANADAPVEEPSFEPGDTTLPMRLVAKVRFR